MAANRQTALLILFVLLKTKKTASGRILKNLGICRTELKECEDIMDKGPVLRRDSSERGSVIEQMKGRWLEFFAEVAPATRDAVTNLGHHVPCPVHGGQDGFRFFPQAGQTGGGVCNTCGVFPTGAKLAAWLNQNGKLETSEEYTPAYRKNDETPEEYNIRDSYKKIAHWLKHGHDLYPPLPVPDTGDLEKNRRIQQDNARNRAEEQWNAAREEDMEILYKYLSNRGTLCDFKAQNIRVGRKIPYYNKGEPVSYHYTILAPLTKYLPNEHGKLSSTILAMHRIYLDQQPFGWASENSHIDPKDYNNFDNDWCPTYHIYTPGTPVEIYYEKADVDVPKKTSSWEDFMGASVQICGNDEFANMEVAFVGEGLETMFAFRWLSGINAPTYATLTAGNLEQFEIPPNIKRHLKTLVVAVDADKSGRGFQAFDVLKKRMSEEYPHLRVVMANPAIHRERMLEAASRVFELTPEEKEQAYPKGVDWDNVSAAVTYFDGALESVVRRHIHDILDSNDAKYESGYESFSD